MKRILFSEPGFQEESATLPKIPDLLAKIMSSKILIIDDEEKLRNLLARLLKLEGYAITKVANLKKKQTNSHLRLKCYNM